MLVLYLYTQQVNKLFMQLNNQKIFESQIHEVFDYYFVRVHGSQGES